MRVLLLIPKEDPPTLSGEQVNTHPNRLMICCFSRRPAFCILLRCARSAEVSGRLGFEILLVSAYKWMRAKDRLPKSCSGIDGFARAQRCHSLRMPDALCIADHAPCFPFVDQRDGHALDVAH